MAVSMMSAPLLHGQAGARVAVVLHDDVGVLGLDGLGQGAKHGGLADAGHVLETYLGGSGVNQPVCDGTVILNRVYGGVGDAKGCLRGHAGLGRPLDAGDDVTHIVQTAEDAGNVNTLGVLHTVHHLAHIVGHGVHTQGVETPVEHVGLDAHLVEWLAEGADSIVGVLSGQEVYLFKCTAVGFHTRETSHVNDGRSNALQLVLAWLKFP